MTKKEVLQAEINIGMIGHVDHGKTSLVQALTGKWTDTHSEELKRGISIRLGYADVAFYKCEQCRGSEAYSSKAVCPNCKKKTRMLRKVSFIDAPGHETLMATMLSGAALMQGAVLVISANEPCPQPRTEEHLMALNMGGVKNIIVAQNKVDLVDREVAIKNYHEIRQFLKGHGYENAPIIPTAAHFGTNIDVLIEAIENNIPTPKLDSNKPLKMYVARSFDINRPGTRPEEMKGGVLGGSIMQGTITKGDEIEICPGPNEKKMTVRVAGLSIEEGLLEKAGAGGLIAVATLLDPSLTRNDQMRGQIVGKPGTLPEPTKRLLLEIHPFKRLIDKKISEIKVNDLVVLTVGTMTAVGTVTKKLHGNDYEVALRNSVVIEKNQRVAISKKHENSWRLSAYGISK